MSKTKYTYNKDINIISATTTQNVGGNEEVHTQTLNITPHIFLDTQGEEIIKQLREDYIKLAEEFKQRLGQMVHHDIKKTDAEKYSFIRAIELSAFINSKWYLSQIAIESTQDYRSSL
jgi:hypothetical protein